MLDTFLECLFDVYSLGIDVDIFRIFDVSLGFEMMLTQVR